MNLQRHAEGRENESTPIMPFSSIASSFLVVKTCLHFVDSFPNGESNCPVLQCSSSFLSHFTISISWTSFSPLPRWTKYFHLPSKKIKNNHVYYRSPFTHYSMLRDHPRLNHCQYLWKNTFLEKIYFALDQIREKIIFEILHWPSKLPPNYHLPPSLSVETWWCLTLKRKMYDFINCFSPNFVFIYRAKYYLQDHGKIRWKGFE